MSSFRVEMEPDGKNGMIITRTCMFHFYDILFILHYPHSELCKIRLFDGTMITENETLFIHMAKNCSRRHYIVIDRYIIPWASAKIINNEIIFVLQKRPVEQKISMQINNSQMIAIQEDYLEQVQDIIITEKINQI
jgi:hypothetical protein